MIKRERNAVKITSVVLFYNICFPCLGLLAVELAYSLNRRFVRRPMVVNY